MTTEVGDVNSFPLCLFIAEKRLFPPDSLLECEKYDV